MINLSRITCLSINFVIIFYYIFFIINEVKNEGRRKYEN